jgi:hypothetical protein
LSDWIKIYETEVPWQAELVKAYLDENEVQAIVINQRDSSYQVFGSAAVMVPPSQQHTAEALLLLMERNQ